MLIWKSVTLYTNETKAEQKKKKEKKKFKICITNSLTNRSSIAINCAIVIDNNLSLVI